MSDQPQTLEGFAHSLPARFLHCRELGHDWRPATAQWLGKQRAYERVLRCRSCRSEKVQVVNRHGGLVSTHLRYSAGYLAKHVEFGGTSGRRDQFRLEAIVRTIEGAGSQPAAG